MDNPLSLEASVRRRAVLLDRAENDTALQAQLLEMCRRDPVFWFNNFCWTFDPRRDNAVLPFDLYPFQEECLHAWMAQLEKQEDFLILKSRDMGVTWLLCLLFEYCWLFRPGWDFLIGSEKEDKVDVRGDISTHFEKMRFNIGYLPAWMKPKGWKAKSHATHMTLKNPENDNVIRGDSTNPQFGRGGRYRAIGFDEFAFWTCDGAAWAAASQATKCRIAWSTPYGKTNKFASLATDAVNKVIEIGSSLQNPTHSASA
jgi:hypothetical protein